MEKFTQLACEIKGKNLIELGVHNSEAAVRTSDLNGKLISISIFKESIAAIKNYFEKLK